MTPTLEVTATDRVPADARVCHYDELTGDAKHALPEAVANGSVDLPWRAARQFVPVDVVKYTAYYHVDIADLSGDDAGDDDEATDERSLEQRGVVSRSRSR